MSEAGAFIPILNHVMASNIKNCTIVSHPCPYTPPPKIQAHIAMRLRENPLPFDGSSWRLITHSFNRSTGHLTLEVGLGKYSQYRYTNLDPELRKKFPDSSRWFNTLALGALLKTADGKICFTKRPDDALLSPGRLDLPCGHPTNIKEIPSNKNLPIALRAIIEKELGTSVPFMHWRAMLHICEEPKWADDLMCEVITEKTGDELQSKTKKELYFIDATPEKIERFCFEEQGVSRPVHFTLMYYGREMFGEEWFMQFCREEN